MFRSGAFDVKICGFLMLLICLLAGPAATQETDRLFLKGESSAKIGHARKETPQKLVWQRVDSNGNPIGTKEYEWDEVDRIKYGNIPDALSRARKLYRQGKNLDKAIELLNEFTKGSVDRSLFLQKAVYLKAKVLYRKARSKADYQQTLQAFDEATKRFPRYREYPDLMRRKISLAMEIGKPDLAREAAEELAKTGGEKEEALASYLKGSVAMEEGNCKEAIDHFEDATDSPDPAIENKARLGIGNCYMKTGDLNRARDQYESILSGSGKGLTESALAGAHNGLGRILFQNEYRKNAESEGARKKNVKTLKKAILHFLRGVIQYSTEAGGDTTETERSLYWTAKSFAELSLNSGKAEDKSRYQKEARRIVNTLLQDYPNTRFKQDARKLKRKLQP